MDWHEAIFAIPAGTDVVTVFTGMDGNVLGSVDVDAIKISLLGGEISHGTVPFIASLGVSSGTWFIDDGVGVASNINIDSVGQSSIEITVGLKLAYTEPIINVELFSDFTPGLRFAVVNSISDSGAFTIRIQESDGIVINPNLISDGAELRIIGFGMI